MIEAQAADIAAARLAASVAAYAMNVPLEEVADRVKNVAAVERMPLMEGNTMTMILTKAKPSQAVQPKPAGPAASGTQTPPPGTAPTAPPPPRAAAG